MAGVDHHYFGKSRNEETKEKNRESLKGTKPSIESRKKEQCSKKC